MRKLLVLLCGGILYFQALLNELPMNLLSVLTLTLTSRIDNQPI